MHYTYSESPADNAPFEACYRARLQEQLKTTGLAPIGRVAASAEKASETSVPVAMLQGMTFVSVVVNDSHSATLLVDTGSTRTVLSPAFAKRIGISAAASAPSQTVQLVGGSSITMPLVRAQSLTIGSLSVKDLEVGVYDALPHLSGVEGLLGADFLSHFKLSVDQDSKQLTLEVVRPARVSVRQVSERAAPQTVAPSEVVARPQWTATPLTLSTLGEPAVGRVLQEEGISFLIAFISPVGGPKAAHALCDAGRSRQRTIPQAQRFADIPCRPLTILPTDRDDADFWVGYGREPNSTVMILGGNTPEGCRAVLLTREEEQVSWQNVACVPVRLREP